MTLKIETPAICLLIAALVALFFGQRARTTQVRQPTPRPEAPRPKTEAKINQEAFFRTERPRRETVIDSKPPKQTEAALDIEALMDADLPADEQIRQMDEANRKHLRRVLNKEAERYATNIQ